MKDDGKAAVTGAAVDGVATAPVKGFDRVFPVATL